MSCRNEGPDDVERAIRDLERRLKVARRALRREELRVHCDVAIDRAATLAVFLVLGVAFAAAVEPPPSRVKAPFTVVDGNNPVFTVLAAPVPLFMLFTPSQKFGAGARIAGPMPEMTAYSKDAMADIGLVEGSKPTVDLSADTAHVSLTADADGEPTLDLTNGNGVVVAEVGWGELKAGHLYLTDPGGGTVVDAGMTTNGNGAVQTFPNGGKMPGRTFFGLPGTFICGVGCD